MAQPITNDMLDSIAGALTPPRLTRNDYGQSVVALAKLAFESSDSGKAAAQVLLSGYNSGNWQLAVSDLCYLDTKNLNHALVVMEGRATLQEEPHTLLKNGDGVFADLQKMWRRLHIDNRWKRTCGQCFGDGEVFKYPDDEEDETVITCPCCAGKGLLDDVREF